MTTAPAAPQEHVLYGPDGQALASSTPTRAAIEELAATAGNWRAIRTTDNATVWEKTTTAAGLAPEPKQARLAASEQRIADFEAQLAAEKTRTRIPAPTGTAVPAPAKKTSKGFDHWGPWLALWAAVGLTASGEYTLAHFVGFGWFSALLPVGIDVYVIQAFRRHRDVAVALVLMVVTNALVHLAEAGLFGVVQRAGAHGARQYAATWWLIVLVSAIAPFIVWRVHRITEKRSRKPVETATPQPLAETTPPVSVAPQKPEPETKPTVSVPARGTTRAEVSPVPAQRETTSATKQKETTETSGSRQSRPTAAPKVSVIGDRETETHKLLDLMKSRGGEMKVSLDDAIRETSRPKATAAKRLKAAREMYLAETASRDRKRDDES
ncbi:hypothetical protein ACFV19_24705 [Streptomyces griseoluteus]|uniref:hypothetical protein n=1 Tax=Streptomyces griseoluteus TaxID=29306 RepID=UPI0036898A79